MLFNSIDFAVFLPIVFSLYWLTNKNLKLQNLLLVISSYLFYGWWDWRFLSLIFFSTVIDYIIGRRLSSEDVLIKRKYLLYTSLIVNLGFLFFFKYYNFFLSSFINSFSFLGIELKADFLKIILPVGISFYTFQTLSYTIDIYNNKLEPSKDFISFAAFVSFFPQLVAGPIERATNLLPQFYIKRKFNYDLAIDGLRQSLWGLFKKVVIADNCAQFANLIFDNPSAFSGSTLALGALFFTFQIYGDFSGYSDIAIGISRLFGFDLKQNFAFPYFSRDIAEFWRRWHISLSTWFRDYLYIPLGGSRGGVSMKIKNTFIIFLVSGFWHGANWTYIMWGLINAIYFLPLMLTKINRSNMDIVAKGNFFPNYKEFISILLTFTLINFAWIFFRAESVTLGFNYIKLMFINWDFSSIIPDFWGGRLLSDFLFTMVSISILLIIEWFNRELKHGLEFLKYVKNRIVRWLIYVLILLFVIIFAGSSQDFIYFQF